MFTSKVLILEGRCVCPVLTIGDTCAQCAPGTWDYHPYKVNIKMYLEVLDGSTKDSPLSEKILKVNVKNMYTCII